MPMFFAGRVALPQQPRCGLHHPLGVGREAGEGAAPRRDRRGTSLPGAGGLLLPHLRQMSSPRTPASKGSTGLRAAPPPRRPRVPPTPSRPASALSSCGGKAAGCVFAGAEGVGRGESSLSALAAAVGAGSQVGRRLWMLRGFLP